MLAKRLWAFFAHFVFALERPIAHVLSWGEALSGSSVGLLHR